MNTKPAPQFVMGFAGPPNLSSKGPLEEANDQLQRSPYLELRRVQCDWRDGTLTLAGYVSSHYLRQIAQATVQRVDGIRSICNGLKVLTRVANVNMQLVD